LMRLALFDVCRRLYPISGFPVELLPLRLHSLVWSATGKHYQAHGVGSAASILRQRVADRRQLGLAEEALSPFLVVTLDPPARVALQGVAPRQCLAGPRHQR